MRFLDLFSGIGGFSLGLERAGHSTVAFCEVDHFCQRVLKKHWPHVPCYGDIRTLTAARLAADGIIELADTARHVRSEQAAGGAKRQRIGECRQQGIDAIAGGFPCQDISVAGKGAGIGGERSGLWSEYRRLVGELRPSYVIVENVTALLGRGLSTVLGDLAALGFDCEWHCIPAAAVGAPHRRDRIWIVAYPIGDPWQQCRAGDASEGARGRDTGRGAVGAHLADANFPRLEGRFRAILHECADQRFTWTGSPPMANAAGAGRHSARAADAGETDGGRAFGGLGRSDWWRVEPKLGFGPDGLCAGLDGGRLNADAEKERPATDMPSLRNDAEPQADQWEAGGSQRILAPDLLQQIMHGGGLCQRHAIEVGLVQTSDEIPWELLRGVWGYDETSRPSHRREQVERLAAEYPDLMRELSHFAPPPCATCWQDGSWENGLSRVALKVSARVDRLRALGNAVVPQIAEIIGRAL